MKKGEGERKETQLSLSVVLRGVINSIKQLEYDDIKLAFPLILWLLLFSLSAHLPPDVRPPIQVQLLPIWEESIFGVPFLYEYLPNAPLVTLVSALPYLLHFAIPWVFAVYLWRMEGKNLAFLFLWVMGVMNLMAFAIQMFLPTAPPWYIIKYGDEIPTYSTPSDPGRLTDIDDLFGISLFHGMYGTNPIVFGSFPSLHAAWPFTIAMYSRNATLGRWKWIYVGWVWWAAVYLTHHYLVDVIGGVMLSCSVLYFAHGAMKVEYARTTRHRLILCI